MTSWDLLSKFILVGNAGVGKSSLLVQLTDQRFLADPDPTVGVEFGSYIVTVEETGERIKCQCWDTAGSEAFRSITRSYYRGAAGALLVYSITNRSSFLSIGEWLRDVREHAEENVSIILVGNMADLCSDEDAEEQQAQHASQATSGEPHSSPSKKSTGGRRQVTREEAAQFAEQEGIMFVEASAKTGQNVEEAFRQAARDIYAKFRASSSNPARAGMTAGNSRPGVISASMNGAADASQGRNCCSVQ